MLGSDENLSLLLSACSECRQLNRHKTDTNCILTVKSIYQALPERNVTLMAKGQSVGKYFFDEFRLIRCVYDDQVEGSSYFELCAYCVFILCKH